MARVSGPQLYSIYTVPPAPGCWYCVLCNYNNQEAKGVFCAICSLPQGVTAEQAYYFMALNAQPGRAAPLVGLGLCYAKGLLPLTTNSSALPSPTATAATTTTTTTTITTATSLTPTRGRSRTSLSTTIPPLHTQQPQHRSVVMGPKNKGKAVECFEAAAALGNPEAKVRLGFYAKDGKAGAARDPARALALWLESAESGYGLAQSILAYCYMNGELGVEKNLLTARKWYERAAEVGGPDAQFDLAISYATGARPPPPGSDVFGTTSKVDISSSNNNSTDNTTTATAGLTASGEVLADLPRAALWLEKSANGGKADAQYTIARWYKKGIGVERNMEKALFWYTTAGNQEHHKAQHNLSLLYRVGVKEVRRTKQNQDQGQGHGAAEGEDEEVVLLERDPKKATLWCLKAAQNGYPRAQYNMGVAYKRGDGVEQDVRKAVEWYFKAAEGGHLDAHFNLALCYASGTGVEGGQSSQREAEWYERAARRGHAKSQYNLALCYMEGEGVTLSQEKAAEWFERAAASGRADAQFNIAVFYEEGRGVAKDLEKAVSWYRRAAEQNEQDAQFCLAECFHYGRGVMPDHHSAAVWYQKAAESGHATAGQRLAQFQSMDMC
eukprot:TRINITY_DN1434_c1_g2_i1.p1 TRINITY_DN1434_c1_g2~~TRINITY_DN1434_c1_g2_i1.p1  ORF type:complete len:611 (-),score=134.94 TRINITY_DN1434_c1_g2_i1:733-2565(-)